MAETTLILAGSKEEYDAWVAAPTQQKLKGSVVYGDTMETVRKVEADIVLEIGSFRSRKDAREMMTAAMDGLRMRPAPSKERILG